MGENIGFRPPHEVEFGPGRQEFKASLGLFCTPVALKALLQNIPQAMQIQNIGGRIFKLRLRKPLSRPVGGLLLL